MLASRSFLFLIVLLLSSVGFAQESDEAKLKEHRQNLLVEQIISDVPGDYQVFIFITTLINTRFMEIRIRL